MNDEQTPKKPFEEIFRDLLFDIMKSAGVTMNFDKHELLSKDCERLSKALKNYSHDSAITAIKRIQVVVSDAFKEVEKDINNLKEKINQLEDNISK